MKKHVSMLNVNEIVEFRISPEIEYSYKVENKRLILTVKKIVTEHKNIPDFKLVSGVFQNPIVLEFFIGFMKDPKKIEQTVKILLRMYVIPIGSNLKMTNNRLVSKSNHPRISKPQFINNWFMKPYLNNIDIEIKLKHPFDFKKKESKEDDE